MPQLTLRAAVTGMVVGAILSLVNLNIGIKTGFAIGMGVTSVVLAYIAFGILSKLGISKQITLLENNAVQSAATAAGYMTGLVTASLPAYMMITGKVFPLWPAIFWGIGLAILGVLFAFPWKKKFINWTDYPFPEGKAAGIVMDGLHSDNPEEKIKVKVLASGGIFAAIWQFFTAGKIALLPDSLFNWLPAINGIKLQGWSVNVATDMSMIGVGGIVGIRTGMSWLLGAVINYLVLAPLLVHYGVLPAAGTPLAELSYRGIVGWTMWVGVPMITVASLYPFLTKLDTIKSAFSGLGKKRNKEEDVLKDIELPMWAFWTGIPLVSAAVIAMGHYFFGVGWGMGVGSILLIAVFTLIAVNSTALTSFTPASALAKLSQLYAAIVSPGNTAVNLAGGAMAAEVTANASNLLMDIKAGYMLGAKPRQQAMAHVLGAIAGAWACTSVFYYIFHGDISLFGTNALPLPGAKIWQGLALVLNQGLSAIPYSARWAILVGALVGAVLEWLHSRSMAKSKKPFPISAIGLSLGFVVPFNFSSGIAFGAFIFWLAGKLAGKEIGSLVRLRWIGEIIRKLSCKGGLLDRIITQDEGGVTLASGLIAGAGIVGIILLVTGLA